MPSRQLLSCREVDESITSTAHRLGFENMGRLARFYRHYFGELPRRIFLALVAEVLLYVFVFF
ncbi:hypothetical protein [Candidatus Accumulibacter sp. ACC003]|uniref:hypothetical protein n=1 Tax=Candidatus Accumulibacter sp. ACC003 TaxID=2823334 RepID=UPI0025C25270|nr:hypothetical protein [Candidatus Accumulibacter sp. ACC003]